MTNEKFKKHLDTSYIEAAEKNLVIIQQKSSNAYYLKKYLIAAGIFCFLDSIPFIILDFRAESVQKIRIVNLDGGGNKCPTETSSLQIKEPKEKGNQSRNPSPSPRQ